MRYSAHDILSFVVGDYKVEGDSNDKSFTRLSAAHAADSQSLVFISGSIENKQQLAQETAAKVVICDKSIEVSSTMAASKCYIVVDNPVLLFVRVGNGLFRKRPDPGIDPTAFVHPEARIHKSAHIGPFSFVGESVIGEGSILEGHCHIYDNVAIGNEVWIQAGAVIGSDGYGHIRDERGHWLRFPHPGGVIIEDDVEIGANACIDCGNLRDTIIRKGAKINNLVHVAHNVDVGEDTLISVSVNVSGSAVIRQGAFIGSGASIRDNITVGANAFVGLGSVVVRDVPDGVTVMGVPARPKGDSS